MLRLKNVSLHRGPKLVLHDVSLAVHPGQKVGVVGANGAGKSSLLALVAGRLACDAGQVERPAGQRVAEVAQDIEDTGRSLLDFVLDGDTALRALERELEAAHAAGDGRRQAGLLARYEDMNGYTAEPRGAKILSGLGFVPELHGTPLGRFSGGWRVRAALARALAQPSELLLLDEPTNHLDLDAVLWLEDWLKAYAGTLLLISHDREFLDAVVGHVAHVHARQVTLYTGNYAEFERARAEALSQQAKAHARQQREVARIQRFVERFRYKATKARQAQSRLKTLARMERIAPAHVDAPFEFRIAPPERLPSPLVALEQATAGYGATPVIRDVTLNLVPGQRLGVLGRNGAGKSTLVKLIAGALAPLAGTRTAHGDLRVGYFAQHQMEQLRDDESALAQLQRRGGVGEQAGRDLLGGYGFSGDDVLRPVGSFSGGERARLVLALIFLGRPNLLLLDEPTNHLDLDMRHALGMALQDFPGAIVLVSHDRYLLESTADELWLVRDGAVAPWDGDLADYARWLRRNQGVAPIGARIGQTPTGARVGQTPAGARVGQTPAGARVGQTPTGARVGQTPTGARAAETPAGGRDAIAARAARSGDVAPGPAPAAKPRKLSYREQRELAGLPAAIERLEREQEALHAELADPGFYRSGGERIAAAKAELDQLERDLEAAFARWAELDGAAERRA